TALPLHAGAALKRVEMAISDCQNAEDESDGEGPRMDRHRRVGRLRGDKNAKKRPAGECRRYCVGTQCHRSVTATSRPARNRHVTISLVQCPMPDPRVRYPQD